MADVEVTERVSKSISQLTATRDGNKLKVSWKIPNNMKDSSYDDRAEWVDCTIRFYGEYGNKNADSGEVWMPNTWPGPPAKTIDYTGYDNYWIKGIGLGESVEKTYDRSRYHPLKLGRYCTNVKIDVNGGNSSGVGGLDPSDPCAMGRGPSTYYNFKYEQPRKPTVAWEFNENTRVANVTVKTDEGKDKYERYDTMIMVTIRKPDATVITQRKWTSTRSTEWKDSIDLSEYLSDMQVGKWVGISCYAYARGLAGDNPAKDKAVKADLNVVFPVAPSIGKITCDKKAANGRVKVSLTFPDEWGRTIQLERRNGETGSWSEVSGAVDNQNAVALYDSYGGANPQPGEYVYYRVKCTRQGYTSYSAAVRADCLFTAKPKTLCTATVGIVSATPVRGGTQANSTATVVIGFTDVTVNEGCELSWAEAKTAWNSNEGPSTYEYDGSGVAATGKYKRNRTVTLTGLTSGVTYYLKARRYRTVDNVKYYSDYSEFGSVTAESAENDSCGFDIITPGSTGTTCTLVLGINENNVNTGTEITWSDHSNAWQSNEQPELLNATWAKASYGVNGWAYKQTTYLRGLEPGTTYYVRARRYDDTGGATTYSPYSKTASFTTPSLSENYDLRSGIVSVTGGEDGKSAEVVVGWSGDRDGCEVSWADDPNAWESSAQPSTADFDWADKSNKSYYYVASTDTTVKSGKTYYTRSGSGTAASPYVYTKVNIPTGNPSTSGYYERKYTWSETGTFFLHGLEEGTTYYVRARSYVDRDGEKSYSAYSSTFDVTPFSAPAGVSLSAPAAVARGESIEVFWTVDGEIDQTEWAIHEVGKPFVSLASGTGSLCHATIPASRYGNSDSISFYVDSGYGGGLTQSNEVTVGIADYPSCEIACSDVLTAQPETLEAYTDDPSTTLLVTCVADGVSFAAPGGNVDQLAGEIVWTTSLSQAWSLTTWGNTAIRSNLASAVSEAQDAYDDAISDATFVLTSDASPVPGTTYYVHSGSSWVVAFLEPDDNPRTMGLYVVDDDDDALAVDNARTALADAQADLAAHPQSGQCYKASIELPTISSLYDSGSYRFMAQTVEPMAGLASAIAETPFTVAWAHQAPTPPSTITVTPDVETRSVTIQLAAPQGAVSGDCYDVYRTTPTGHDLVAYGLALDAQVVDMYAPFGQDVDLSYRIACRTVDGDEDFMDYSYSLPLRIIRLDWDGGSVELPYNNDLRESYSKNFESRNHVDGSVNGYWERGSEMSGSYSSDVVKLHSLEQVSAVRALAEHDGPCFCRTRDGMAFQCNANVTEVGSNYMSPSLASVKLDVKAIKTTDEFMLRNGDGA